MKKYVTDFANPKVVGAEGTIVTPHLGASTKESEDNCAVMAVKKSVISGDGTSKTPSTSRTVIWVYAQEQAV